MSWVLLLLALVLVHPAAGAAVPAVQLSHGGPGQPLNGAMSVVVLPASQPADPETFWNANEGPAGAQAGARWDLRPGERVVGRVQLQSLRERASYVIQVPVASVDHVQVWWREPGEPWHAAEAGDRVPLSRWPHYGQFPAFPLAMTEEPLDLIVTAANGTPLALPIVVKADPRYREDRLLQANLTGLAMGLGVMGAVVSLIAALTYRRRASWVLLAYSVWAFVYVACNSGYTAIWLTPGWPEFNDQAKPFTQAVMAGLLLAVMAEVLDHIRLRPWMDHLGETALVGSVFFATADIAWIAPQWRPAAAMAWAGACVAVSLALCLVSYLGGARHMLVRVLAVVAFALAMLLAHGDFGMAGGVDWAALASALLLFASPQLLRHGQFLRERYGRDVLGRAALSAHRDPLTAVLSYTGLQHSYEEAMLRQLAGRGTASMILIALPKLDESSIDHGFLLTERALVRFAAALQHVLGHDWSIGRLSKTRFAAVTSTCPDEAAVVQTATRILAHCARMKDPLSPVEDFDLRMVCLHGAGGLQPFKEALRAMEEAGQAMDEGKRIAVAECTVAAVPAQEAGSATVE